MCEQGGCVLVETKTLVRQVMFLMHSATDSKTSLANLQYLWLILVQLVTRWEGFASSNVCVCVSKCGMIAIRKKAFTLKSE